MMHTGVVIDGPLVGQVQVQEKDSFETVRLKTPFVQEVFSEYLPTYKDIEVLRYVHVPVYKNNEFEFNAWVLEDNAGEEAVQYIISVLTDTFIQTFNQKRG